MPPAVTIDDCINQCSTKIATLSYGGVASLFDHWVAWTNGMFGPTGIFSPTPGDAGQRTVSNWFGYHLQARDSIESPGPGESGPFGTSTCIDAAFRVLTAIKFARLNGFVTVAQVNATIALFNVQWP